MEAEDEQAFLTKLAHTTEGQVPPHQSQSPRGGNGIKAATGVQAFGETTALASFFNSLLKKDPGNFYLSHN
jgi:hypothetical protein